LSHEMHNIAEAEAVDRAEGKMCGAAMRGADALPGSKTPSRPKGTRRNLGDLAPPAVASAIPGHDRKSRRRSCRGRREESDGCVVPAKPRTKSSTTRRRRVWREGSRSGERQVARRTPDTVPDLVCHRSCEPTNRRPSGRPVAFDSRQEPAAGKPHGGICAGGPE